MNLAVGRVLVRLVVAHVLRQQMAPVRRRVDQHVVRLRRDRAVERHLQRLVARLAVFERQVVAEHDEALRPLRDQVDDIAADRPGRPCRLRSGAGRLCAYAFRQALISDDLPVPRAPVSSTLLAGCLCTNWRVFCSISAFLAVDVLQVVERDVRDGAAPAADSRAPALAPAEGDRRRPVDLGRGGRKQGFQAASTASARVRNCSSLSMARMSGRGR